MIIESLCRYYDILANDESVSISRPGYSSAKVSFNLIISGEGELLNIIDLRSDDKKPRPRMMDVPQQNSRANSVTPYFLCENAKYVFGVEKVKRADYEKKYLYKGGCVLLEDGEKEVVLTHPRSLECFEEFKKLHHSLLDVVNNPAAKGLLLFLDNWNPEDFVKNPKIDQYKDDILAGGNFVFQYERDDDYLHNSSDARRSWEKYNSVGSSKGAIVGQCLVTGESGPVARLHQKIKGVANAQSAGASIVSFNNDAFYSYGKDQSYNAPVGELAMFKYTTVLNHLLLSMDNRIRIGDTTTVFWAETSDKTCENLANFFLNPRDASKDNKENADENQRVKDEKTLQIANDVLKKISRGHKINSDDIKTDRDTRFYILGLSPNNARIAVRFWYMDSFGNFIERVSRHYLDMEIVRGDFDFRYISVRNLLRETVPESSDKGEVSPLLGGLMMNSILNGTAYPAQMYNAILSRVKVERSINYVRAGFIKAYLFRLSRSGLSSLDESLITMSLNEESQNVPYRLGRLFAVLEKVQGETNKDMGSTINSKYFSSASSTPAVVFPVLLKLAQHHIAKSEWGFVSNKSIEEILSEVNEFPEYLNLEGQGMFMLGYYHQRKNFYKKKESSSIKEE
ncbi:type I-C CRISPR-associated protein Cas8c/Csd1 [Methanoplanus sp. FWC-SCC4]|uniref:Type I-C CRISPR-associated protein Cas8c/Csd1 n=1 Tax=Methanochimaera problematica TaxID=2609417 RepID=A0AA97I5D2_9EURY|nr:type I-C CRISPR-associated protein Cas8c/Csd1 [Methanoplanus sp. FWC-SCC4]